MRAILLILIVYSFVYADLKRSGSSVSDSQTNLQWQDDTAAKTTSKTWTQAIEYCEALRLDAHDDWRLPNKKELFSIVDRSRYSPAIDDSVFLNTASSYYWSSTTNASNTSYAWSVRFYYGYSGYYVKTDSYYVRCVRGGQLGNLEPIANAGEDQTAMESINITLSDTNSSDSDGNITNYEWKEGTTILSTSASFSTSDFSVGTHILTLTVTDNQGLSASDEVIITVNEIPTEMISIPYYSKAETLTSESSIKIYEFTTTETSEFIIKTASKSLNLDGKLYDENGYLVSSIADFDAGIDNQLYIKQILTPGTYNLRVFNAIDDVGTFTLEIESTLFKLVLAEPWNIDIPEKISIVSEKFINIPLKITSNDPTINFKNLNVTATLPTGFHLEKGTDTWRLISTSKISEDMTDFNLTLNVSDTSLNFSAIKTVLFKIVNNSLAYAFNKPVMVTNGNGQITVYPDLYFNLKTPTDLNGEIKSSCYVVKEDGTHKSLEIETSDIENRYICKLDRTYGFFIDEIKAQDYYINFNFTLPDGSQLTQRNAVKVKVYNRDDSSVILERLGSDDGYNSIPQYLIVNDVVYNEPRANFKIYLGGVKGQKDFVELAGGAWKITSQGHETIIDLLGTLGQTAIIAFTLDNDSDLANNEDVLTYIADPDTKFDMFVKKVQKITSAGTIWSDATDPYKIGVPKWLIKKCNYINVLTQAEPEHHADHPCFGLEDGFVDDGGYIFSVRGTTLKIHYDSSDIKLEVYEGIVDVLHEDKNITLIDNQFTTNTSKTVQTIQKPSLTSQEIKYLQSTSLYSTDENSSVGSITVKTNEPLSKYSLIGTDVQIGEGTITQFDNVADGNYTLHFFPVIGRNTPNDINITIDVNSSLQDINTSYTKAPYWSLISSDISIDVLNRSKEELLLWQYENDTWKAYSNSIAIKEKIADSNIEFITSISINNGLWIHSSDPQDILTLENNETLSYTYPNGWSLAGTNQDLNVSNITCDRNNLFSIWKFNYNIWQLYTPSNIESEYEKLNEIYTNDGFWVHCK